MACAKIQNGFICSFNDYRNYICLEHTTYLFEFSRRFGPAWFTVPDEEHIEVHPDGSMSFLWDIFEEWHSNYIKITEP